MSSPTDVPIVVVIAAACCACSSLSIQLLAISFSCQKRNIQALSFVHFLKKNGYCFCICTKYKEGTNAILHNLESHIPLQGEPKHL